LSARQVAIYLTRELTDLSLPQIGRLYGGRDHSTVLNSIRRVEARIGEDQSFAAQVQELRAGIHNQSTGRP
jgi:chromosomal replication initiator protein